MNSTAISLHRWLYSHEKGVIMIAGDRVSPHGGYCSSDFHVVSLTTATTTITPTTTFLPIYLPTTTTITIHARS